MTVVPNSDVGRKSIHVIILATLLLTLECLGAETVCLPLEEQHPLLPHNHDSVP